MEERGSMRIKALAAALALVGLAALLALAQAGESAQVKVEYNEAKGRTSVTLGPVELAGAKPGRLLLNTEASYEGKEPRPPKLLLLTFSYEGKGRPRFKDSRDMTVTTDGRRYHYETGAYFEAELDGVRYESMIALIEFDALQDAMMGKAVAVQLGDVTAKLTPAQINAMRAMLAKFRHRM